ncbi:MAG: S8 family serine peptidase [Pseudomonadota bacterium]
MFKPGKIGRKSAAALFGASMLFASTALMTVPAHAELDGVFSSQTMEKLADATVMSTVMELSAAGGSDRVPVIIQYVAAEFDAPNGATADEIDKIHIAANSTARDAIIAAAFGSVDDALNGPLADERNISGPSFMPHLFGNFTPEEIDALAADPNVEIIQANSLDEPMMDESTAHIDMPPVWTAGGTGFNYSIAVLDTGTLANHEFITGAVVSEACYNLTVPSQGAASRCPGGAQATTASGSGADCIEGSLSGCGHGTHVAGTALGFNTSRQSGEPARGMAYQAGLISINVFTSVNGSRVGAYVSDQILGMDRAYALRNTYNVVAINMSLGGSTAYSSACDLDSRKVVVDKLRSANIATLISAGNASLNSQVNAPGCISSAITVASSLDQSDSRSWFSNWGSLIDVVAPGSNILSSGYHPSLTYVTKQGTSMAAPHVAGAWAALRQLYPSATVSQIETALESTGVNITSSGTTKPRIDMDNACASLGGGTCGASSSSGPIVATILPTGRGTQTNNTVTAFASIINAGSSTATGCSIAMPNGYSGGFLYQTTNSSNQTTGSPNTAVDIPAGGTQNFYFALTPTSSSSSVNVPMVFDCTNTDPATTIWGVNSFIYSSSSSSIPDIVAIGATVGNTGYIDIPGTSGIGAATVSSVNIGASGTIVAQVVQQAQGGPNPWMPATLQICRSTSGSTCTYGSSVTFTHNTNAVQTFNVIATGSGTVANDPALNRAHIYFRQGSSSGPIVGGTSFAVRTQ